MFKLEQFLNDLAHQYIMMSCSFRLLSAKCALPLSVYYQFWRIEFQCDSSKPNKLRRAEQCLFSLFFAFTGHRMLFWSFSIRVNCEATLIGFVYLFFFQRCHFSVHRLSSNHHQAKINF